MVDKEHDEGSTGEAGSSAGDPALRSWALQAAAGVPPAAAQDAQATDPAPERHPDPLSDAQPDVLTPAEAEAAEAAAAAEAVAADAEAAAADAGRPVDPTADGPAPIPWFMPGAHVPDPGPEPDDLPVTDEDAPVSARSWSEAELWTIPRDELDARISNVLPPSVIPPARLEPIAWPAADHPGLPRVPWASSGPDPDDDEAATDLAPPAAAVAGPAVTATTAHGEAWAPASSPPAGDGAGEAPGSEDEATHEGPSRESLRPHVVSPGADGDRDDRPRLTPATLGALVLLVLAALSSFAFMLTRGGAALPGQSPRSPAAFVSQAPAASGAGAPAGSGSPLVSVRPGGSATQPAATLPAVTLPPAAGPTAAGTVAPSVAPSVAPGTVLPDRRYPETDPAIAYAGTWGSAAGTGYAGGAVAWSGTAGAQATLTFTGRTITWWGPVGPTRGSAAVYVDGALVATVSAYEGSFGARRALFTRDFGSVGEHTIRIVVSGTAAHPTVAIDELVAGY